MQKFANLRNHHGTPPNPHRPWPAVLAVSTRAPHEAPRLSTSSDPAPGPDPEPIDPAAPLRHRIAQWQSDHYEAFLLMTMVAMADGKTSREELRLMARFFAEQGAPANEEELAGIDHLNAGLSLRIAGQPDAAELLGSMADRPRSYLLGLYGALYALTGCKRQNASTTALLGTMATILLAPPIPATFGD